MEDKTIGKTETNNQQIPKEIKWVVKEQIADRIIEEAYKEKIKRELAKRSFKHFIEYVMPEFNFNKFNLILIQKLQDVFEWKVTRLVINMPPRHGKSLVVSELFPAWVLWNRPDEEFMNIAYALTLSSTSCANCLKVVQDPKFNNIFPNFKLNNKKTRWDIWETITWWLKNWKYEAIGIGWWITGKWFTIWIIDDPVKSVEESDSITIQEKIKNWFWSDFFTRQQKGRKHKTSIIIVMTRRWVNDLIWYLDELEIEWLEPFERLIFPAVNEKTWEILFPERFTIWDYEQQKKFWVRQWEALYMQNPIKAMWQIFKNEYYKYFYRWDFDKVNWINKKEMVWWIHIDPAFSTNKNSDDTVIMLVWQNKVTKEFYLWDIDWWTVSPTEAYSKIFNMCSRAELEWLTVQYISIEQVAINHNQTLFKKNFLEAMRTSNRIFTVIDYCPKENKQDRILWLLEWKFQQWIIHFLNKSDSKWNQLFKTLEDELERFPNMKHDDYPDCLAQAIEQLPKRLNVLWVSQQQIQQRQKQRSIDPYTWLEIRI